MTEAEWLVSTDPAAMLEFLKGKASDRKLRLFACACCWRVRHLFRNDAAGDALNASEQFADGLIGEDEMQLRRIERHHARNLAHPPTQAIAAASHERQVWPAEAAQFAADAVADTRAAMGEWATLRAGEQGIQCNLVRDIFGNPFHPVTFSSEWHTDTVVSLARQIYESRDFSAMPILADALQDAGCDNDEILEHCRDASQVHIRGCWVVDLVLGKE